MPPISPTCSKCNGDLVQGVSLGSVGSQSIVGFWRQGQPKKSFWFGFKMSSEHKRIPVAQFRCNQCGFLEAYARTEFAPK